MSKQVGKLLILLTILILNLGCTSSNSDESIADVNHIIHLGQSLGAGEHSLPIVTDSITGFGNLSFKMGTHTYTRKYFESNPELRDLTFFSFIPLVAHERGHEGETLGNGLCDHLKSTSESLFDKDFSFLFSFTGQGGRLIRELDKGHDDATDPRAGDRQSGGGYYKTAIDDVRRSQFTANQEKLSYSVFAITWMQGESNEYGHLNRWEKPYSGTEFLHEYLHE